MTSTALRKASTTLLAIVGVLLHFRNRTDHEAADRLLEGAGKASRPAKEIDTMPATDDTSQDFTLQLTAADNAAIQRRLSQPGSVRDLNTKAKQRIDRNWGIDPDSPTEFETDFMKKAR